MELKRKHFELIEVSSEFCFDTLFTNELYNEPFMIETKHGSFHTVTLVWRQGYGYYFCDGDDCSGHADHIHPSNVAFIEVR